MTTPRQRSLSSAFTLLEMVVVLAISAMLLSAMFSVSQGTIILADDIQKHQRRESRLYAYIDFCQRLLSDLPATATLDLRTTQDHDAYLSTLELQNVSSPFDGAPKQIVTLKTESVAGGGMRLLLTSRRMPDPQNFRSNGNDAVTQVVLMDNLVKCEWRAFDPMKNHWFYVWREQPLTTPPAIPPQDSAAHSTAPVRTPQGGRPMPGIDRRSLPPAPPLSSAHPLMLELILAGGIDGPRRWVFWIPPSDLPSS